MIFGKIWLSRSSNTAVMSHLNTTQDVLFLVLFEIPQNGFDDVDGLELPSSSS